VICSQIESTKLKGFMRTFQVLFPTFLLLFFFWKARKNLIYLLGIPLLYTMGPSVMFSFHFTGLLLKPGRFDTDFRLFFLLFLVWLICRLDRGRGIKGNTIIYRRFGEFVLSLILIFATIHAGIAIFDNRSPLVLYYDYSKIFYMVIGYFMLKQIFLSQSWKRIKYFFRDVLIIICISILMFTIHQGLGIKLFPYGEYYSFTYMGASLTRSFGIMNPFFPALLAYSLVTMSTGKYSRYILIVTLLASIISYTRSLLLAVSTAILASALMTNKAIKNLFLYIGIGVAIMLIGSILFETQFNFAKSRMLEVNEAFTGYTETNIHNFSNVPNVSVRQNLFIDTYKMMNTSQRWFGQGFAFDSTELMEGVYDNSWQGVLKYFGITGIVLFIVLFINYAFMSIKMTRSKIAEISLSGKFAFLVIVIMIIQSFTGMAIFPVEGAPLVYWIFALISSTVQRKRES